MIENKLVFGGGVVVLDVDGLPRTIQPGDTFDLRFADKKLDGGAHGTVTGVSQNCIFIEMYRGICADLYLDGSIAGSHPVLEKVEGSTYSTSHHFYVRQRDFKVTFPIEEDEEE